MPVINITDLNNAQLDVTHISAIATSTAATATDRLGNTKKTIAGISAQLLNAGIFANTAAGLAATINGQYFSAIAAESNAYLVLYLNNAGVAVEQKRYPTTAYVTDATQLHATEAIGRAAVADGAAFKVQGAGDIAAFQYRRTNSGASVLIASYPTIGAVAAKQITSGDVLPTASSLGGDAINGAAFIVVNGKRVGFTIPAGQSGDSSNITLNTAPTSADMASLAGKTVIVSMVMDVTANFITEKPSLDYVIARVYRTSAPGTPVNVGAVVRMEQIGLKLIREVSYVMTATDISFGLLLQVGSTSTANAHSLQVASMSYRIASVPALLATSIADAQLDLKLRNERIAVDLASVRHFGIGPVYPDLIAIPQYFNGAVARAFGGKNVGWTIPAGQTGQNTLVQVKMQIDAADSVLFAGRTVRIVLGFDTSAGYARTFNIAVQTFQAAGNRFAASTTVISTVQSGSRAVAVVTCLLAGDEIALAPFVQNATNTATAQDDWVVLTDMAVEIVASSNDTMTLMDENARMLKQRTLRDAAASAAAVIAIGFSTTEKAVRTDGTGDYLTPKAATLAITDASISKRYIARVYSGIYTDSEWHVKSYLDIVGASRRESILAASLPDSQDAATISNTSTVWLDATTKLEALTITAKNMRYAIHLETNGVVPNSVQQIVNCHVEHFGNPSPNNTWFSQFAVGAGVSSGEQVNVRGSTFRAPSGAFSYHNNVNFADASFVDIEGSRLICTTDGGFSMRILSLGSKRPDRCRLVGNVLVGDVVYGPSPWLLTALADQPANHAEIDVFGYRNTPAVFQNIDFGLALKISSSSTGAASSIIAGGAAAALIFGDGAIEKYFAVASGSAGFSGSAIGWGDISGIAVGNPTTTIIAKLGQRLGNCATVNKALTVAVDGGAAQTVTFNEDFTAQPNSYVLAFINTRITGAVASAYGTGSRYRPKITDEEFEPRNTSASGILMGTVLAFDTNERTVRPMTSADASSRFAGVAWEDIPAGATGRVKSSGYLPIADVLRTDAVSFVLGDTFSIDAAAPGRVVKGGSQGLLSAIRGDAVRVR